MQTDPIDGNHWIYFELLECHYEGLRAIHQIFVYCQPIHCKLIDGISVLVNNFHLLDDSGLPTLPRTCSVKLANRPSSISFALNFTQ